MATPLVRIPQPQGGTMYAFASAARDITRAFNNPDLKFNFSRYALIDLPDFTTSVQGSNTLDFSNLVEASGASYQQGDANVDFAQTFQSYALNMEELILQDDDFDPVLLKSDAEKMLFKWLSATGAIRFRAADSSESNIGGYAEESNSSLTGTVYERVVKYLGTIDVENDIAYRGNAYHEVYINVPSSVGNTPTVLFQPTPFNTTATKLYADSSIEGRSGQTHPDPNLDLATVADAYDSSTGPYYTVDVNGTNAVGIDWNEQSYHGVTANSSVKNLLDYAKLGQDFRFNAVLVYYDIYSESTPANRATNLYGILILDDIQSAYGPGSKINEQIKYKPNEVTGINGNAFSLKLNLKFNTSLDNVGVETNINDFTTFSMDLFMDTTTALENAAELLLQANSRYNSIATRVDDIENLVLASDTADDLDQRISQLEADFENTSTQLQSADSLLQMITKINSRINQIINGTIPTEIQYNTDVIFDGLGTSVDKTVPNKIKVNNTVYGYSFGKLFRWNIAGDVVAGEINSNTFNSITTTGQLAGSEFPVYGVWTKLKNYTNRMSLLNVLSPTQSGLVVADGDLNIYIDDSTISWKAGQIVKISMPEIDMQGNNIKIRTRSTGGFDKLIADIVTTSGGDLITNRPYIEVICIDPVTYTFEVDILR